MKLTRLFSLLPLFSLQTHQSLRINPYFNRYQLKSLLKSMNQNFNLQKQKPVIAIDVDEVLAEFVPSLAVFHNENHGTDLNSEHFFSYGKLFF